MIPSEAKSAMQGAIPSVLATCSTDGTPNITHVSQVWYVDERHVAVSFQFFSKTVKNVRENPYAAMRLFDPETGDRWCLDAKFVRSETGGETFDAMEMQLEGHRIADRDAGRVQAQGGRHLRGLAHRAPALRQPCLDCSVTTPSQSAGTPCSMKFQQRPM